MVSKMSQRMHKMRDFGTLLVALLLCLWAKDDLLPAPRESFVYILRCRRNERAQVSDTLF